MLASFSVSSVTAAILIIVLAHCSADPKPPPVVVSGVIPEGSDQGRWNSNDLGSDHLEESPKDHEDHENFGDSVVHLLLAAISPFRPAHAETKNASVKDDLSKPVPVVELEKLKTAAKSSGLSDSKANRVRRAAEVLNLGIHDIVELRKAFSDPTTTAEHGDWMRTALEKQCIHAEHQRSLASAEASPIPITPDEFQRLKTAAKLSGLQDKELEGLAKVMEASKLSKEQLAKLEEAIVQHGPTPLDLKKLTEQLAKIRKARGSTEDQEEEEYDWNNPQHGYDWLFSSPKSDAVRATDKAKSSTA